MGAFLSQTLSCIFFWACHCWQLVIGCYLMTLQYLSLKFTNKSSYVFSYSSYFWTTLFWTSLSFCWYFYTKKTLHSKKKMFKSVLILQQKWINICDKKNRCWTDDPIFKGQMQQMFYMLVIVHFSLKIRLQFAVPDIVQKNSVPWLESWLEGGEIYSEGQKILGCSAKMISNALWWQLRAKGRRRKWKTVIRMYKRITSDQLQGFQRRSKVIWESPPSGLLLEKKKKKHVLKKLQFTK